jgi:hypothetical protein
MRWLPPLLLALLVLAGVAYADDCPDGFFPFPPGSEDHCEECPSGTFSKAGWDKCEVCAAGMYSLGAAADCALCPPGTFATLQCVNACVVDLGPQASLVELPLLVRDTVAREPWPYCQNCSFATQCASCIPGTYNDDDGQLMCKPCGQGLFQPSHGASRVSSCLQCPAGSCCPQNENARPTRCGGRSFSSHSSSIVCE